MHFILITPRNWKCSDESLIGKSNCVYFSSKGKGIPDWFKLSLPLRIKEMSHKMPNLDRRVKSRRKWWNGANLWSRSKFLLLLPPGFVSIHGLPMWSLESEVVAAELGCLRVEKTPSTAKKWNSVSNSGRRCHSLSSQALLCSFLLHAHIRSNKMPAETNECQDITFQDRRVWIEARPGHVSMYLID